MIDQQVILKLENHNRNKTFLKFHNLKIKLKFSFEIDHKEW